MKLFVTLASAAVVLAAIVFASSPASAALVDGLALYSSMEGATGATPAQYWEDVSGNGRHFLDNIAVADRSADLNTVGATNTHVTALNFEDGSAATSATATVIDGLDSALEPGTGNFSFSLWYNEISTYSFAYILNNGNTAGSGEAGFTLYTGNGQPGIRMQDVNGFTADPNTRVTLNSGLGDISGSGWHHVVGTFDRTGVYSAPNTVSLYVDGYFANSVVLPDVDGNPYNISLPAKQLRFGGREISNYNFEGYIDDVAIYDGVLSATDVTTLLSASSVNENTVTTAGVTPVAIYNFENNFDQASAPGVVPDDFGSTPGVLNGAEVVVDAEHGDVVSFGQSDAHYADYGDNFNPGDGDYTVSVWFKADADSGFIASKGNASSGGEGWSIWLSGGKVVARAYDGQSGLDNRLGLTSAAVTLDEWHHVALVLDNTNQLLKAYVDGQGAGDTGTENGWTVGGGGAVTNLIPADVDFFNADSVLLGRRSTTGFPYGGDVDDFAIWNRALTEQEIMDIFNGADILEGGTSQPGDLNGDGYVNSADLDLVRGNWGSTVQPNSNGDADGDGYVNSADLDIVRGNWGAAPAAAVPEPSTLMLLVAAVAALALRRKK